MQRFYAKSDVFICTKIRQCSYELDVNNTILNISSHVHWDCRSLTTRKYIGGFYPSLTSIFENFEKIVLCRLRVLAHILLIEMGRYDNTPRTERICRNCMRNEIEDEENFII